MSSSALFEEALFSQKKPKLEGLYSNTSAAQPKKPNHPNKQNWKSVSSELPP